MSSVVETRKATSKVDPVTAMKGSVKEEVPADLNIPDNYVTWTLKNQKPLPPITLENVLQNIQWLTFAILTITPSIAIWGLFNVKLRWETALWSVIYYFITGLGESYSSCSCAQRISMCALTKTCVIFRYYRGLPAPWGTPFRQRVKTSAVHPCGSWHWRSRGLYQVVVPWTPRPPSLYRHRSRSLQCAQGILLLPYRLDALQAPLQAWCC